MTRLLSLRWKLPLLAFLFLLQAVVLPSLLLFSRKQKALDGPGIEFLRSIDILGNSTLAGCGSCCSVCPRSEFFFAPVLLMSSARNEGAARLCEELWRASAIAPNVPSEQRLQQVF